MAMGTEHIVNTVLGPISADAMGITLEHEHLAMNPGDPAKYAESIFDDPAIIIRELADYTAAGGKTIVEMSPLNFGRDVKAYREISRAAGIHVICATGFHKQGFLSPALLAQNDDEIEQLLVDELEKGIEGTDIRAGVVKIGTSLNAVTEAERRLMHIAARVQQRTGTPINTHCEKGTMALEQAGLLSEYGADPARTILGHVDIPNDTDYLKQICARGFNVGIDHVGRDLAGKDSARIEMLKALVDAGYIDQIFLAGDMGKKSYLRAYGGKPGLGYILCEFKAYWLAHGLSEQQFLHILVDNPRRVFGLPVRTSERQASAS